jgi:hypothetical protein
MIGFCEGRRPLLSSFSVSAGRADYMTRVPTLIEAVKESSRISGESVSTWLLVEISVNAEGDQKSLLA